MESTEGRYVDTMFVAGAAAQVGRRLGREVSPREITSLLYDRRVPEHLAPVVGGRRLIHPEAVELIVAVLRARGAAGQEKGGGSR
jgi:hypothetical protein